MLNEFQILETSCSKSKICEMGDEVRSCNQVPPCKTPEVGTGGCTRTARNFGLRLPFHKNYSCVTKITILNPFKTPEMGTGKCTWTARGL